MTISISSIQCTATPRGLLCWPVRALDVLGRRRSIPSSVSAPGAVLAVHEHRLGGSLDESAISCMAKRALLPSKEVFRNAMFAVMKYVREEKVRLEKKLRDLDPCTSLTRAERYRTLHYKRYLR